MFRKLLLLTAFILLVPTLALAGPFTSMYVFGDSLSDGGNAFIRTFGLFPPPPYAQRFSNGPVAVERLAANLGVTLTPSLAGGTNYAIGGAATGQVPIPGTSSATNNFITVEYPILAPFFANQGIDTEIATFIGSSPVFDPATALFVLWGGPNDFFIDPSVATAAAAIGNIFTELLQLYGVGARNFLVPNMPDLAITPSGLSQPLANQIGLHQLSVGFNGGLKSALDILSTLPGMRITQFDTFGLFNAVVGNPGAFGFTNVTTACITDPSCNPNTYLFWDSVHPTTAGAAVLGDEFTNSIVPEPATLMLLAGGLAAIRAARRRRQ